MHKSYKVAAEFSSLMCWYAADALRCSDDEY